MSDLPDKDILSLLLEQKCPEKAMRIIVVNYKERIYRHIRSILISHEDSNDVTQEVFIKIWKNLVHFRGESSLYTWIYRIATNESLNYIRKNKKHSLFKSETTESYLTGLMQSDTEIEGTEIEIKLQKAIISLPDQQRIVFNMRYFEEIKFKEIAQILNLSEGGAKSNYHIAEKKVKEFLKGD